MKGIAYLKYPIRFLFRQSRDSVVFVLNFIILIVFILILRVFLIFMGFYGFNGVIVFESILSIKGVQLRIRLIKGISSFISFYVFCDLSLIWGDESF